MSENPQDKAKRDTCGLRYDLIPGDVMDEVAKVFAAGAERYGDNNWKKSRLSGEHGPINHALKHLNHYNAGIPDDESDDPKIHLSHAIVNCMFELHYELNKEKGVPVSNPFNGKSFVFTGFRSPELTKRITMLGGYVGNIISKNTFALVMKKKGTGSSKEKKAQSLGVTVLEKEELAQLLEAWNPPRMTQNGEPV